MLALGKCIEGDGRSSGEAGVELPQLLGGKIEGVQLAVTRDGEDSQEDMG